MPSGVAESIVTFFVAAIAASAILAARASYLRGLSARRLGRPEAEEEAPEEVRAPDLGSVPFVRRHTLIPLLLAAAVAATLHYGFQFHAIFAAAAFAIISVVGIVIDKLRFERACARIEAQLADAIDLMVGSLRAGAGLLDAFESAARESEEPLRQQLVEVGGKIRLGDDPRSVLRNLAKRVPLATFDMFVLTLTSNWEVGGSLAPGLSTVGRGVRDRIDLTRRVRALTTQSRLSVIGILAVSYFIGILMWRAAPHRMEEFLGTDFGRNCIGGALLLQAVGLIWISWISEVKY
jgi:tight adherence protein B